MAHITSAEAISRFAPMRLTGGTKFPRVPPPASGGAWNDFYLEGSNDKMGYIHFTEEQKLRAGSVDLVEFLARRGGNAISFVREFSGYSYPGAVSLLLGGEQGEAYKPAEQKPSSQERKPFVLPDANSDMRRVYAYLLKQRHIGRDVLTHFAREKTIFEDAEYHNAVFVGCDENGVPLHAP